MNKYTLSVYVRKLRRVLFIKKKPVHTFSGECTDIIKKWMNPSIKDWLLELCLWTRFSNDHFRVKT